MAVRDIDAPGGEVVLTRSNRNADGVVVESIDNLLSQCQMRGYPTSSEEYALARVVASERGDGPAAELLCIGDADINRSKADGLTVLQHVTARSLRFGKQGSDAGGGRRRPVSTSRDPSVRHLRVARLLMQGTARGISKGAQRYFDAKTQDAMWATGNRSYMRALAVLERWTFNKQILRTELDSQGRRVDVFGPERSGGEEWVGAVAGVDAFRTMLFRPAGRNQRALYELARRVIESRGADQPSPGLFDGALSEAIIALGLGAATTLIR